MMCTNPKDIQFKCWCSILYYIKMKHITFISNPVTVWRIYHVTLLMTCFIATMLKVMPGKKITHKQNFMCL